MWTRVKYLNKRFLLFTIFVLVLLFIVNYSKKINSEPKIKFDTRTAPSEEAFVEYISKDIPYLPIEDLVNPHYYNRNFNSSCAWYPNFSNVKIHNDYWQEYQNGNISYFIYGAYFDNRPTVVKAEPAVQVLTMINFIAKTFEEYPRTYCQFWYEGQSQPFLTPMKEVHKIWYYNWTTANYHYPHFISCPIPKEHEHRIPRTVSLVANPCDNATNNVRVTYFPLFPDEQKKEFAVCVKGLDYPLVDMSHRIIEFVETLRTLGAEKIIMHKLQVHPNTTKVLKYYSDTGYLEYRPTSMSTDVSSLDYYQHLDRIKNFWSFLIHEAIQYNDCLYRNMYRFKYVAIIDIDEVLMPLGNISNWHDLMTFGKSVKSEACQAFANYCFRGIYFPRFPEKSLYTSDIPEYFYMLQHVQRVRDHLRPEEATKCLHSTDYVIGAYNHRATLWTSNVCQYYSFEANVAQLNHYREPPNKETLNETVMDLSLWRLKDEVIERSMTVFQELGFLSDE